MKKYSIIFLLAAAIASCNNDNTNENASPSGDSAVKDSGTGGAVIDGNMRGNSNAGTDTVMSNGTQGADTTTTRKRPADSADRH